MHPLMDALAAVLFTPGPEPHLLDSPSGCPPSVGTLQAVAGHPKNSLLCSSSLRDLGLGHLDVHCFVSHCFIYSVYIFWTSQV